MRAAITRYCSSRARLSKKSHPALFAGIDGHKDRVLGRVAIGLKRLKSVGCGLRVLTRPVVTCRRTPRCDTQAPRLGDSKPVTDGTALGGQIRLRCMTYSALMGVTLQVSRQAVTQVAETPKVVHHQRKLKAPARFGEMEVV